MAERITKAFVSKRLETTTKNLRMSGILRHDESLVVDSTGSDRLPHRLYVQTEYENGARSLSASMSSNVDWKGLNAAVDALYEISWLSAR